MTWKKHLYPDLFLWTLWYAWHPVTIGDFGCWLQYVERRAVWGYDQLIWEYRLPLPPSQET